MAAEAMSIGRWRELFGSQVFEALDAAITIAALDDPAEFRRRRDHIMELLFAPPAASPAGIGKNAAAAPVRAGEDADIAKIFGKEDDREAAPTSKALVRPEASAAASSSSTRAAVAAALSGPGFEAKLAATKRKMREGYEEAADAKRQRRIQVIVAPEMANQRRKPVVRVSRKVCAASSMGPGMRTMLATSSLGMCN